MKHTNDLNIAKYYFLSKQYIVVVVQCYEKMTLKFHFFYFLILKAFDKEETSLPHLDFTHTHTPFLHSYNDKLDFHMLIKCISSLSRLAAGHGDA